MMSEQMKIHAPDLSEKINYINVMDSTQYQLGDNVTSPISIDAMEKEYSGEWYSQN